MSPATDAGRSHAFLLCFLAGLCEGYDMMVAGVAAPKFAPSLGLEPTQLGAVFAAATLGLFIGAIGGGRLADLIGRKRVIIGALVVLGVFSIGTALVSDLPSLVAMRLLAGLGLGGALPNILALTAETAAPGRAAARTITLGSAMPLGGGVVALIAVAAPDVDWRTLFWLGGVAPLALAAIMMGALPESPAFADRTKAEKGPGALAALAEEGRLAPSLLLWAASFCTSLVLYMLVNWLPSLMVAKGFSTPDAAVVSMLMTVGGAASGFAYAALSGHGRRRLLYGLTWAGMIASVVGLALAPPALWLAAAGGFGVGFFLSAGQFLLYALSTELYPAPVRGAGVGFAVGVGRLGAVAGPLLAGAILAVQPNPATALAACAPLLLLALIAAVALGKERRLAGL